MGRDYYFECDQFQNSFVSDRLQLSEIQLTSKKNFSIEGGRVSVGVRFCACFLYFSGVTSGTFSRGRGF